MSKEVVVNTLKKLGWSDAAINATLGNIAVETGGTFDYKIKQKGGPGYGLFQFDFFKPYYQKWLKQNKMKDSPQAQATFYHDTIYGDSQNILGAGRAAELRKAIETQDNPAILADTLAKDWFRPAEHRNPGYAQRVQYAQQFSGVPAQKVSTKRTAPNLQIDGVIQEQQMPYEGENPLLHNPLMDAVRSWFK